MNFAGRATAIVVNSSNPLNLYLGAAQGGVWKSTDGGTTWTPLTDTQVSLSVGALALSPDQKTIYAGTGEPNHSGDSYYGAGILASSDGGKTWSVLGSSVFSESAISAIVVGQSNPRRMVASTTLSVCCKNTQALENPSGIGVFLSTDGGSTWTETLTSPTNVGVASLIADPSNANTIFAGDFTGQVWRSTDGGTTWTVILSEPTPSRQGRVEVALTPALPGQIFAAFSTKSSDLDVISRYSVANGSVFYMTPPQPPSGFSDPCSGQCDYDLLLAVDPSNSKTIYFGALELYKSTDGGKSWTDLAGYSGQAHPDQHALAFSPSTSNTIFLANDGGVWKSTNQGGAWSSLNNGVGTLQFQSITPGPRGSFIGGTQDNGCLQYTGSTTWNELLTGDGGWVGYEAKVPSIVYCAEPKLNFAKSVDGGQTWQSASFGLDTTDASLYYVPVAQDQRHNGTLILGTVRVYQSTDFAQSWSDISGNLGGGPIGSLAYSPSNSSVVWLGDSGGNIRISYRSGAVWKSLAQKNGVATGIAVNATNPYQAYVSVSQVGVVKLTRTAKSPVETWQVLTLSSPNYNVNVIRIDPATNYIYAGTDIGVYYSSDGGNTWKVAGAGLPNVAVFDMTLNSGLLFVATHGRGIWSLPLLSSVTFTLSYSVQGDGSSYSSPTLTYISGGLQKSAALSTSPASFVIDLGTSWSLTNPLAGSTASERWITIQASSGSATSSQTINFVYYNQYYIAFNYTLVGGGVGFTRPTIQFTQFGSSSSSNAGSSNWVDAGTTYSYPTILTGSSSSERWVTTTPTGTAVSAVTVLPNFFHQYLVHVSYGIVGGGAATQPVISSVAFGSPYTQPLTLNPIPYWLDAKASYTVTNPLQGSGNTERWFTFTPTGTITSPAPLLFSFSHQYLLAVVGATLPPQWFASGTVAKFNITGAYGRTGGTGSRLVSYTIDGGGNTTVPSTTGIVSIEVQMSSTHTLTLKSVTQYQVFLDAVTIQALNSTTPPSIAGDTGWYDSGSSVTVVLNGVWNRTSVDGNRLTEYSVNSGSMVSVSSLKPVIVLMVPAITNPYSLSALFTPQYFLGTSSGSLASVTPPSIQEDPNWYDRGSSVTAVYNYVWNSDSNQSRLNAMGYSIGGSNHTLARSGRGTFQITLRISEPTNLVIISVPQYRVEVSGGHSTGVSAPSPTGDGYYDSGSTVAVTTNYVWNESPGRSRDALISYLLDGVLTNITRAEAGNFTTPSIQFKSFHSLVFNSVNQFFVAFHFTDASGSRSITPSSFEIKAAGHVENGLAQTWVDNATSFSVAEVIWEGANVTPLQQPVYSATAPVSAVIVCRVYQLTLHVTDALGLPIAGARTDITLANGTIISGRTTSDGAVTIPLVPQGRFNATVSSLGTSARFSGDASAGPVSEARGVISSSTVTAIVAIIVAGSIGSLLFLRKRRRGLRGKGEEKVAGGEIEVSEDEL